MNEDIIVYIASHKEYKFPELKNYVPIHVGAALTDKRFCELTDWQGDNISKKNPNYCELTALYWIWKNSTAKIVGLCHYRRYLGKRTINGQVKFLDTEKIVKDLTQYDIILPSKYSWKKNNCWQYYVLGAGREKDLYLLEKVVREIVPEYLDAFYSVMNGNQASYCNVMVCKKELFDEYAEWLFQILIRVEEEIDKDFLTKTRRESVWIYVRTPFKCMVYEKKIKG